MAIKRYDNVQLDGKPMKIELIGTNMGNDGAAFMPPASNYGGQNGPPTRYYLFFDSSLISDQLVDSFCLFI